MVFFRSMEGNKRVNSDINLKGRMLPAAENGD